MVPPISEKSESDLISRSAGTTSRGADLRKFTQHSAGFRKHHLGYDLFGVIIWTTGQLGPWGGGKALKYTGYNNGA